MFVFHVNNVHVKPSAHHIECVVYHRVVTDDNLLFEPREDFDEGR